MQPERSGLKLKIGVKSRHIYIENLSIVSVTYGRGLKIEGILKMILISLKK